MFTYLDKLSFVFNLKFPKYLQQPKASSHSRIKREYTFVMQCDMYTHDYLFSIYLFLFLPLGYPDLPRNFKFVTPFFYFATLSCWYTNDCVFNSSNSRSQPQPHNFAEEITVVIQFQFYQYFLCLKATKFQNICQCCFHLSNWVTSVKNIIFPVAYYTISK